MLLGEQELTFRKERMILQEQVLELILGKDLVNKWSLCMISDDHFGGNVNQRVRHSFHVRESLL